MPHALIHPTDPRHETSRTLLASALDFWSACNKAGQLGAVQWLEGSNGELLIFTRSEYRRQLLANIERLNVDEENLFSETLPSEDEEE